MNATQKLHWTEADGGLADVAGLPGRVLWVDDGCIGHHAALPDGVTVPEGLADYAAGYNAGEDGGEVAVNWRLFVDGEETDICPGEYVFTAR